MKNALALILLALPPPALAHEGHIHAETAVFAAEALHPADVAVTDQTGRQLSFRDEVVGEGPVMMTFVYSNCTTVCPVANTVLQLVEEELDRRGDTRMRLVSVSIDPVTDTPDKMAALAHDLGAGPRWRFVTGRRRRWMRRCGQWGRAPNLWASTPRCSWSAPMAATALSGCWAFLPPRSCWHWCRRGDERCAPGRCWRCLRP